MTDLLTTTTYEVWSRVTESGEVLARHNTANTLIVIKGRKRILDQEQAVADAEDGPAGVEYFIVKVRSTREEYTD